MSVRVIIACKKTTRESFAERYGAHWLGMLERFDLELQEVQAEHAEHYRGVDALVAAFRGRGIEPRVYPCRSYQEDSFAGADLVVSVGGDGEMLDVARYVRGAELVVGFRSNHGSVGRLLLPPALGPAELAERFATGRHRVEAWTRIEGTVHDGGPPVTDLALNEIYVGDRYSVGTARYTLHLGPTEEKQRSSGIVVASGAGSTGWYANIVVPYPDGCHRGAAFDRRSPELRFVVRDLIHAPDSAMLSAGVVAPGTPFTIKSTMNADGLVSFDCSKLDYERPRAYPFNRGARVEIRAVPASLRVLVVD